MKVKVKKKDDEKADDEREEKDLPEGDEDEEEEEGDEEEEGEVDLEDIEDDDDSEELPKSKRELEHIKKIARLEARLETPKPGANANDQQQAYINAVYADLDMDDDDFKEKYRGYSKAKVIAAINQETTARSTAQMSSLAAKNSLTRKYPDFFEHEEEIDEALSDAAPHVLQDPTKLKSFMERAYKALSAGKSPAKKAPKFSKDDDRRKKIVNDFEPPTPKKKKVSDEDEDDEDAIKEENRGLAAKFKLHKESDRKRFSGKYIPMELGAGVRFVSPEKGFEKADKKK